MRQIEVEQKYYRPIEVSRLLGVTPETLRLWVGKGKFPAPVQLGERVRRWRVEDVDEFLARRGAAAREEDVA